MKRATAFALVCALALASVVAPGRPANADLAEWQTYRNAKYGYEIRYPRDFESWPTGPADERDGRALRIARKQHSAAAPVLDIRLNAPLPALEPPAGGELRDMDVGAVETEMNGIPARQLTYRWKSNGEIVFFELHLRDASLVFHAQPGIRDARETIWWKIISTFRFTASSPAS